MKSADSAPTLVVGSRVHSSQAHAGPGTIVEIHGDHSSGRLHGVEFDLVFDNGNVALSVPASVVCGPTWRVEPNVFSASQIEAAKAHAAEVGTRVRAERDAANDAHELTVATLRAELAYADLRQGDNYDGKLAATNIRRQLANTFPRAKFQVRKVRRGELAIAWVDGPVEAQVHAVVARHLDGFAADTPPHYFQIPNPWAEVFGGVRHVVLSRSPSYALLARAIEQVFTTHAAGLVGVWKPSPEDVATGHAWGTSVPGSGSNLQELVYRAVATLEGE